MSQIVRNGQVKNQYLYGALNRLEQAINHKGETARYSYNGLGHRIGKQLGNILGCTQPAGNPQLPKGSLDPMKQLMGQSLEPTQTINYTIDLTRAYHNLLQSQEIGTEQTQTYLWDGNVVGISIETDRDYYLQDELGSPIRLLNERGELREFYGYDEFGQELYQRENDLQPFTYTGYQKDSIAETYHVQAREYCSKNGRFTSEDTHWNSGNMIYGDSPLERLPNNMSIRQSTNLYLHCINNPLKYIDSNGQDCYVFYLPEWKDEALDDRKRLMKEYDIKKGKVHLVEVTDNKSLSDGWNDMGKVNAKSVDIQAVVINTHANPEVLGFGTNSNDSFGFTDVAILDEKDVEKLILYGCNAGHSDYIGTNPASQFSAKVKGAPVLASDGTVVSYRGILGLFGAMVYRSDGDDDFEQLLLNGDRDNIGWMLYYQNGKKLETIELGNKKLKLKDMLEACELD